MKELIACCGIDCEVCDARIATVNNDNELREKTAQKWREMFGIPEITAESINCMGCRTEGVKILNCTHCQIRNCVQTKGFATCGECGEIETCSIIGPVFEHMPEAKARLLS
jgi:hypothetical protein